MVLGKGAPHHGGKVEPRPLKKTLKIRIGARKVIAKINVVLGRGAPHHGGKVEPRPQ